MPELPEVETVRRGLAPVLEGQRLAFVEARRLDLRFALPTRFAERMQGARVVTLARRAKYLLGLLDTGDVWLSHLGMSGRYRISGHATAQFVHDVGDNPVHDHVLIRTETGAEIVYHDPRRFGFMDLIAQADLPTCRWLAGLGPEPLSNDFHAGVLSEAFAARRSPVKAGLLDQMVVAGLGNIYVCEALFRAGIAPTRLCLSLSPAEIDNLVAAIRTVLEAAILAGGSSLRDFAHTDGALGYFQHGFDVYDREGQACHRCKGTVMRIVQSGRSSFYCPDCQH